MNSASQTPQLNLSCSGPEDYRVRQELCAVSRNAQRNSKSVASLSISAEFEEPLWYEDLTERNNSLNL